MHHLESSQQLGKVGIVLMPIFLMRKPMLAQDLQRAWGRATAGAGLSEDLVLSSPVEKLSLP